MHPSHTTGTVASSSIADAQRNRLFRSHNRHVNQTVQITEKVIINVVTIHQAGSGLKEFRQSEVNNTKVTPQQIQTLAAEILRDVERRLTG